MIKRKYCKVYGQVQAVGFRHFAKKVADKNGIVGYVRNEYDGTVVLEIQGEERVLNTFFEEVERESFHIEITRIKEEFVEIYPKDEAFRII